MSVAFRILPSLLLLLGGCVTVHASVWEVNTLSSASYNPPMLAISLEGHNAAFSSSSYCIDGSGVPNYFSRDLCNGCESCAWKNRDGFNTESDWREAVTSEMARLTGQCDTSIPVQQSGGELKKEELLGAWIAEASETMELNSAILEEMGSTLGVSLKRIFVVPAGDGQGARSRRFFEVSGTMSKIRELMKIGFSSTTPIPPRLKVDPVLEEEAAAAAAAASSPLLSATPDASFVPAAVLRNKSDEEEDEESYALGLYVGLSEMQPPAPAAYLRASVVAGRNASLFAAPRRASSLELATTWANTVASRVGHTRASVVHDRDRAVTIHGLTDIAERYAVALDIAMHGEVTWVTYTAAPLEPTNYFASKIVQEVPPLLQQEEEVGRGGARLQSGGGYKNYATDGRDEGGGVMMSTSSSSVTAPAGPSFNVTGRNPFLKKKKKQEERGGEWDTREGPLHQMNILGQGQVVGVADFGLDYNSCYFYDIRGDSEQPKFEHTFYERVDIMQEGKAYDTWESTTHRKLRQYVAVLNDGANFDREQNPIDHGTHVCGSIAGNPFDGATPEDATEYRGVAPQAKLAFYDFYLPMQGGGMRDMKTNRKFEAPHNYDSEMFPLAYSVGARIYSMSFSEIRLTRVYNDRSQQVDAYCHEHQDFVVFGSAGNKGGIKRNPDMNITPPSNAKSVVTVGSHMNLEKGYTDITTINQLSPTSSRGPTHDGRIKPDICAPGDSVISASSVAGMEPGSQTCSTSPKTGSSMATPIAAGAATLVRQYFTDGFYPLGKKKEGVEGFTPMGALLKAILVNSGRQLQVAGELYDENESLPSYDQGWGAIDMSTTLITPFSPPKMALKVYGKWTEGCNDCPVVHQGETLKYKLKIVKSIKKTRQVLPLKVTLAWFDKEAGEKARSILINNIDLAVEVEGEQHPHHPNGLQKPDRLNTVEHITIPGPTPGRAYTVTVKGKDIPLESQYFALVINGPFEPGSVKESVHNSHERRRNKKPTAGGSTPSQ